MLLGVFVSLVAFVAMLDRLPNAGLESRDLYLLYEASEPLDASLPAGDSVRVERLI